MLPLLRPELLPEAVTGGRDTLGLRIPDHPVPRALARQLGPIAVTSANRSGEAPARTAARADRSGGHSLALVLDDGPVRGGVRLDGGGRRRRRRTGACCVEGALDDADIIAAVAAQD